jgi:hypothetical protein
MKAYRFLTQWVCLLLAGMSPLQGNTMASSNKTDYEAVDEYITARMRSDHIPGVALAGHKRRSDPLPQGLRPGRSVRASGDTANTFLDRLHHQALHLASCDAAGGCRQGRIRRAGPALRPLVPPRRSKGLGSNHGAHAHQPDQRDSAEPNDGYLDLARSSRCDRAARPFAGECQTSLLARAILCLLQRQLCDPGDDPIFPCVSSFDGSGVS